MYASARHSNRALERHLAMRHLVLAVEKLLGHCGPSSVCAMVPVKELLMLTIRAAQVFSERPGLKLQRRAFIVWDDDGPKSVFIVKKPHSPEASAKMKEIGDW